MTDRADPGWQNRAKQGALTAVNASPERPQVVGFGIFEVDRECRELRKQGRRIRLQDQSFHVLSRLLDRPGAVVTREELRHELWPGSVVVDFDHGLNNAIARLREALGDNTASPQFIETLPRLGYRFIYPVRERQAVGAAGAGSAVEAVATPARAAEVPTSTPAPAPEPAAAIPGPSGSPVAPRRWPHWKTAATMLAAAALLAGVALVAWDWLARDDAAIGAASPTGSAGPSIAVLPFASLSDEADDEYFADGLTDELSNQLARIEGLKVAGRTSAFHFKDRDEPAAVIADTLKVKHLLEGSVRRSGERVRVTAQLVDAHSGYHLWSETFERDFKDIFAIQDEIALSVASALHLRLLADDERQLRMRGTHDAEAYRLYLMGMARFHGLTVRQDPEGARQLLEQAIARDPRFGAAYAGLASYHLDRAAFTYVSPEESARLGREAAERAIALQPDGSDALRIMGGFEMWRYRFLGDSSAYDRADALFRRAIEADPSNRYALFDYGRTMLWYQPERARQSLEQTVELDPLARGAVGLAALAMSRQGMHEAARLRLQELVTRPGDGRWSGSVGTFEAYLGHLDVAAPALLRFVGRSPHLGAKTHLWGIYMSLGDRAAAGELLRTAGDHPLTDALRTAAILGSEGRHAAAFEELDRRRAEFPTSRILDLPAARFALVAGEPERARVILEERLPDLATGTEVITAPRVLPALDLVLAWSRTGRSEDARRLLDRVAAFLDGPDAPRLPMFTVQRARAHALAGKTDAARQALERAYTEGFRVTCVLDLHPQSLLYVDCIDADPAFTDVRSEIGFDEWLARIGADNRAQLERLRSREAAGAAADRTPERNGRTAGPP